MGFQWRHLSCIYPFLNFSISNFADKVFFLKHFVPFPAYSQPQQQQPNGQAPLAPTGFIQGEQGALIPLYQPEALDQYMTSGTHPLPSQSQIQNLSPWRQYPHAPSFPFITVPQMTSQTPAHPGNMGWMPSQPPLMFPASGQQSGAAAFRGGGNRMNQSGQHPASTRRHRQSTYDRNIPTRPPNTRYAVGGINNMEQAFNSDHDPGRPNVFAPHFPFSGMAGAGGWNQWNGGR